MAARASSMRSLAPKPKRCNGNMQSLRICVQAERRRVVRASTYNIADQERMAQARNYFAWQSRLVGPELGRRVVEVGCGLGNFTRTLLDREAVIALDGERDCIERLVERYPNQPNLHAFVCDAASDEFT